MVYNNNTKKMKGWSKKFNLQWCKECKTDQRKHISKGLCTTCYYRWLYRSNPKRRKQVANYTKKWMRNNPKQWKKIYSKANKKYRDKNKI